MPFQQSGTGHSCAFPENNPRSKYKAPTSGIFAILPTAWIPYAELMRLDRPAGFFAFYWHYLIGISFTAATTRPVLNPVFLALVAGYLLILVIVLRGAVCTVNDNLDQEFDRKVARTQCRPIARGAVSTGQANLFAFTQFVLLAFLVLKCPFSQNLKTASAYFSLHVIILTIYPLAKRVTDIPQLILGIGFAAAIPFSSAMITPFELDFRSMLVKRSYYPDTSKEAHVLLPGRHEHSQMGATFCLCAASVIWTVIFDTIYAHQDSKDDIKAGVRSLAVRLGDHTKPVLAVLAASQVVLLVLAGLQNHLSMLYFVACVGGVAPALASMLIQVDLLSSASCMWCFGNGTAMVGGSLVAGLFGEYLAKAWAFSR